MPNGGVMNLNKKETAGELSKKANRDTTKYDAIEVGHALADDILPHLQECIKNHYNLFDEEEFCVVMLIAKDPLIPNLMRRKFYAWPYLPSPRPNQAVFLYNKPLDRITKRLWVLPSDMVMAELASTNILVHKKYQTMQAWSVAFYKGTFWEYIRHEHEINMPSESEYLATNRDKLIQAGCKPLTAEFSDPFDFSKIQVDQFKDTQESVI